MWTTFGLAGRPVYLSKPRRTLQTFRLQCHTGVRGDSVHTIEAQALDVNDAIQQCREAGYRMVAPML